MKWLHLYISWIYSISTIRLEITLWKASFDNLYVDIWRDVYCKRPMHVPDWWSLSTAAHLLSQHASRANVNKLISGWWQDLQKYAKNDGETLSCYLNLHKAVFGISSSKKAFLIVKTLLHMKVFGARNLTLDRNNDQFCLLSPCSSLFILFIWLDEKWLLQFSFLRSVSSNMPDLESHGLTSVHDSLRNFSWKFLLNLTIELIIY